MTPSEALKQYWNFDTFRPMQEEVITSVLQRKDTLVLMPTGGGKSLCYQIPAVVSRGLCLVVSPLIALMKDQVTQLRGRGISAACLVSGMNRYEMELLLNNCIYGNIKLLYVSPERLRSRLFIEHFKQMNVSLIAVDEAHCISQWGYDFRPPYLEIGNIRDYMPKAPVVALTATATPEVLSDIQQKLRFRQGVVIQKSFYRENLSYMVVREEDKMGRLLRIINKVGGSGIVYVRNRRRVQEVARYLSAQGIAAEAYHAGYSQQERDTKQSVWNKSDGCVMVATNAFGMGIDKPNVRFVVHLDIPESLEAYFQEAGRAGRDGNKAYAVLLYDEADKKHLDYSIEQSFPTLQQIRNVYMAICNFYKIPVGSGAERQFDFDIQQMCSNYGFTPITFYSAARFLEKEGLIALPEQGEVISRIYVPISKEELYRYEVENHRNGDLMRVVLRMYGGIFSDFTPIVEKDIARRCQTTESVVTVMLQELDKAGIISYKPKAVKPQIVFLSPRINADMLYISDANYSDLKDAAVRRKEQMIRYVSSTDSCRSQMLLAYFGETTSAECGICDVCLRNKQAQGHVGKDADADIKELTHQIQLRLTAQPMTIKELVADLGGLTEDGVVSQVRDLIDREVISVDKTFRLHWEG